MLDKNKQKEFAKKIATKKEQEGVMDAYLQETNGRYPIRKWLVSKGYNNNFFGGKLNEHLNACGCTMAADGVPNFNVSDYSKSICEYRNKISAEKDALLNASGSEYLYANKGDAKDRIEQIFVEIVRVDGLIAKKEQEIDTYLFNLEKAKDNPTQFDLIEESINAAEQVIATYEVAIKGYEAEADAAAGSDAGLKRKVNREGRQAARKDKRNSKKARKDNLRNLYGKGSAYRNAKKDMKKDVKDEKKTDVQKYGGSFVTRLAKFMPVSIIARNSFLGLAKLNFANMAARIGKSKDKEPVKYEKVIAIWKKIGGDEDSLNKAIDLGKKKKPLIGKKGKYSFDGADFSVAGYDDAAILAMITAASTITLSIIDALGGKDKDSGDLTPPDASDPNASLFLPLPTECKMSADKTYCTMPDGTKRDALTGGTIQEWYITYQTPLIIGGVTLVIGGVLLIFRKEIFG